MTTSGLLGFGPCPLSTTSWNLDLFQSSGEEGRHLGPLERVNLNQWARTSLQNILIFRIPGDGPSPKPINSVCYTQSSEFFRI
jgi:hypothetical protein